MVSLLLNDQVRHVLTLLKTVMVLFHDSSLFKTLYCSINGQNLRLDWQLNIQFYLEMCQKGSFFSIIKTESHPLQTQFKHLCAADGVSEGKEIKAVAKQIALLLIIIISFRLLKLLFAVLAKRHEKEKWKTNEGKRSVFQPPVSHKHHIKAFIFK